MTTRLMPPGDGLHNTIIANGRTYSQSPGNTLDLPDQDAGILIANGWVQAAVGSTVGSTAARPTSPVANQQFIDTTLGAMVVWDAKGKVWRNHVSGAAV